MQSQSMSGFQKTALGYQGLDWQALLVVNIPQLQASKEGKNGLLSDAE